jgi:fatty acid desaturase
MRVLRHSSDALLIALAAGHGALLLVAPSAPLVALGLWWNANTVSHNFIHLPFFRARTANTVFSLYLSLLLGLPQTLWRDRHLAHHADKRWRWRWSGRLIGELVLVGTLWLLLASLGWRFFLGTWLAGWLAGVTLCFLQGYFEHVRGTVSHYGKLYNVAFFNDGYHAEHHARPGLHWSRLPQHIDANAARSRWPAALRWLEIVGLESLERLVLRSNMLQRYVLSRHRNALAGLIATLPEVKRVAIVGGGLFPRTALALQELLPDAEISIVDRSRANIDRARAHLNGRIRWVEAAYSSDLCGDADLLVIPLSFQGDRGAFYAKPPAAAVLVHEWIWRPRGTTRIVSFLLLKRLNLTTHS